MSSFWKLMRRTKAYKSNVLWGIVFNILLAVFTVVSIPLVAPFFQILFDRVPFSSIPTTSSDRITEFFISIIQHYGKSTALMIVCGLLVLVFFLKNVSRYLSLYVMASLRTGIVYDIRSELYQKYLHLPLAILKDGKMGDYISRMSSDVQEIEYSILKTIEVVFKSPLIIIGSIGYMLYLSPQLLIFVIGLLFFTVFIIGGVSRSLKRNSSIAQEQLARIIGQVEETISGGRIVKSFNAEPYLTQRFDTENSLYKNVITKLLRRQELSSPLSEFLGVSIVAILMFYGSFLVFRGKMLPEAFFAFIFAFYQVIEPAKSFSTAYYGLKKGAVAIDRIDAVLEQEDERAYERNVAKSTFDESLKIENVSFAYNAGDEVLKNISLEIKKGETLALVGASGSGKSTLVDLIQGFYTVSSGRILMDNVNVDTIAFSDLRNLMGLVSQHAILFNDTVTNNIAFGSIIHSPDKVVDSAKTAFAHTFIERLVNGYDTNIGDKGMKLSGGQRQRLTIARAVYNDPEIFILDEATSALDSESEQYVQEALDTLMQEKTAIVIAHRLATIKNANTIIVMDNGQIVAQGTHQELIKSSILYKKYVSMQTF